MQVKVGGMFRLTIWPVFCGAVVGESGSQRVGNAVQLAIEPLIRPGELEIFERAVPALSRVGRATADDQEADEPAVVPVREPHLIRRGMVQLAVLDCCGDGRPHRLRKPSGRLR